MARLWARGGVLALAMLACAGEPEVKKPEPTFELPRTTVTVPPGIGVTAPIAPSEPAPDVTPKVAEVSSRAEVGKRAVFLAAGKNHNCLATETGQVICWGSNVSRQLGARDETLRYGAVVVPGIDEAVEVACGGNHTCVRLQGGQVLCWGSNKAGAVGDGTNKNRRTPAMVIGLKDAAELTAGDHHTCARKTNGRVV